MNILLKNISIFIIGCVITTNLNAASFYVDNAVATSGNGTSWATAWKSFGDINWGNISPGDIIYISGGDISKTYHERLTVNANGTAQNYVVITKGNDPNHNGTVILDGQMTIDYGVQMENVDYIVVRGLHVKNYNGSGQIRVRYCNGVVVEDNDIYITGHGGAYVRESSNVIIRNNRMTTPSNLDAQTDGIYSSLNTGGNVYEYNRIVISNENPNGHDDGIQLYLDTDIVIRGNYIEQDNNKTTNAQGIYATESYGTLEVYNNIVYGPNTWNGLLVLRIISQGDARLIAYHNTLVGGGWGTLRVDNSPNSIVKNNILVNFKDNGWVFRLDGPVSNLANINYNLYYTPNSGIVSTYDGSGKSWTEWKNLGYEDNGMNDNPLFNNISNRDFSVQEVSATIDSGTILGAPFNVDISGISRPQGQGVDLGAYEHIILDITPPSAPMNLRVIE